jgi:hypothetical protein
MRTRKSLAVTLVLFTVVGLSAACSSSAKATPDYSKGVTVFFTPGGGKAPVLPASFVNCVYGKASASDRTEMAKVTSNSKTSSLPDAVSVRLTRAADQCDATLTNQLIETAVFTGAPASISAAQKSCATGKIISTLTGLDDAKLKGANSSSVSSALTSAAKSCGINEAG